MSDGTIKDSIFSLLDQVGETADAVDESVYEAGEAKADTEGVIGRVILGAERVERGRNMVHRLTAAGRKGPPGKIETALETFNFLFGDGTGDRKD